MKRAKAMSDAAARHVERVKNLPCGVCSAPGPSDAHHMIAGRIPGIRSPDWLTMPLCKDCHQGSHNGIHGERRMWDVMRTNEHKVLDATLEKLYGALR